MEHLLGDHGVLKFDDRDFQPIPEKTDDLHWIRELLRKKRALKAETLRILKAKQ